MKILIVDCSNGNYVSIIKDSKVFESQNDNKVSDEALLMIDELLGKAKIEITDLDAIAVCVGPGSFTGLRVALTLAKTISYVKNIPLISFTSYQTIAYNNKEQKVRAIKGFSNFVYIENGKKQSCEDIVEFNQKNNSKIAVCEDLGLKNQKILQKNRVDVVLDKFNKKQFDDPKLIEPLYLRLSQAEIEREKHGNKKS